jgi:DNA-binding response OmpR family regulator
MRVLVVEDDPDLRSLLWRVFADARHEVAMAADGGEAIEKVHTLRPELVVLDLVLPGLDGWAVMRSIRKLPAPPPVVMMSVQTHSQVYALAAEAGVAAYIEKPFSVGDLLATCERVLREDGVRPRAPRDRRHAPRRVVRLPVQVRSPEKDWWTDGELIELGSGGARLAMPVPLPADRMVRVAFVVPGEGRGLSVDGVLQWRAPEARGFAYGMSFVDVRPEAQSQIDTFVRAPAAAPLSGSAARTTP